MTGVTDDLRRQILLEIALSISGELELRSLLGKCLPLFLRKLNCTAAAVVQLTAADPITSLALPLPVPRNPEWSEIVRNLSTELDADPTRISSEYHGRRGPWFGFGLQGFGLLILARPAPFDETFLKDFQPLADMLARACLACLESDRRHRAERELAKAQASQRALLDNLPFMAWVKDVQGRYTAVNKSFANRFGLAVNEILGKTTQQVWPADKARMFVADDETVLRTGRHLEGRDQEVDPEGGLRWFEFSKRPIVDPETGEISGTTGFRWEVSDRVRAEQALEHRTAFQQVVMDLAIGFVNTPLENLDQGITNALAMIGRFAQVDRAYLFRYDFVHDVMHNTHEWCAEGIAPEISNLQNVGNSLFPEWVQTHRRGEIVHIPSVARLPNGSAIRGVLESQDIRTLITLPLNQGEECFGFVGFDAVQDEKTWSEEEVSLLQILAELFTNAEARRIRERHLVEAKAQAEAASQAKSEFLANMSHEIRTPLHGVVSMIGLLKETKASPEQREFLHMAETSAESLLSVINDILDFSKIEAGKLELSNRVFDLEAEIHRLGGLISAKAREKDLELLIRYDPRTPRLVEGDNLRLRQVLSNLLANAVKFTERGHVLLNVELLYLEDDQAAIRFLVEDTGIGIPEDRLIHIFEQFTQVDGSTSRRYGGTGLGLAISQQLVGMMGGTITVGSTVGRGSRFFFDLTLPCKEEPSRLSKYTGNELRGRRGMIVDDQSVNRRILAEYLSTWGMEHDAAWDATEALQLLEVALAQGRPYDILLLDHAMPGMTGLELAAALARDARWDSPSVILLTSLWGHVSIEQCNAMGIKAVLPKPIAASDLFNAVRDCLHKDNGQGCTIAAASRSAEPGPLLEDESQPPLRVLLVDDHPINRKSATLILQKLNCEVTTAQNGLEALEMVQDQHFDMVFMDVQMPVMDGYEATQAIRRLGGRFGKLPIVALTANAMEGDRERCLEAGMTDYLPKPMPKEALAAILAAHRTGQESVEEEASREDDGSGVLDVAALLHQYDNDQDMAREMLQDFLADTPTEIAAIEQALARREPDTEMIAHRLKGPSSYVGAARLADRCVGIMEAARRGHWEAADREFQALQRTWAMFAAESEEWLGSRG